MPPVAPISTGTPSTGALLARPTKAPDGKSVSRDRVPTLPTGLHSLPSQGTVLGFSSADSSTLSSRVSSIKVCLCYTVLLDDCILYLGFLQPLVGDAGPLRTSTTNDLSASMGSPVVDSGFILGVHRPKGGPRLSATRLSAPPARMSSLDDPLAVSLDTGVRLMGDVEQTSVAEPSGSIMPPIGGRRKVGVLSLSTKRTAVPTVDPTVSPTPSTQSISVLGATRPLGTQSVCLCVTLFGFALCDVHDTSFCVCCLVYRFEFVCRLLLLFVCMGVRARTGVFTIVFQ